MEENPVQLRRVSGEPFPIKSNPNSNKFIRNKEEGELSSSSDDHIDDRSSRQNVPIRSALAKRKLQHDKAAPKSFSTNTRAKFVGPASRAYVQPNHRKKSEKNRVPFVISFSDDDSGSDPEEHRQQNACEARTDTLGSASSRRPPTASFSKMQILPGNTRKGAMLPRKVSLSRTFVSSMMQNNGASSKNGGHVQNNNLIYKNKAEQEHGRHQNVHLNSSKLQDLRQLIAIRENELKLKAAKKKKESPSDSCKNDSATNLSSGATKISREAHDDFGQYELEEPDRKRLKFVESHACPVNTEGSQGILHIESALVSKNSVLENCGQQLIDNRSSSYKETVLGSSQWQKADENCCSVLAANASDIVKEGTSSITDGSRYNHIVQSAGPSIRVVNRPVDTSKKTPHTAEFEDPVGMNHQPPLTCDNKEIHEFSSAEKAIEPVLKDTYQVCPAHTPNKNLGTFDTSQNNSNIWNSLGKLTSGTSNMDLQALMEIEELQDKELEEAQEYRHKCELEERNALKAYRKSQRATMEANSRCAHLYRKRELFSAQLRSLMMDNPSMIWSSSLHDQLGEGPSSFNNLRDVNLHVVPSGRQTESENDPVVRSAQQNVSGLHENIQDLAVDPGKERDTSMFWSSSLHDHLGEEPNSFNDMPEVNMHAVPSGRQMEFELYAHSQCENDTNVRSANVSLQKVSSQHEDRQDLDVDPSSEPNARTSEPEDNNADTNAAGSQSSDSNMSAEEGDETFLIDHETNDSNLEHQRKEEIYSEHRKHVYDESRTLDNSQDSLLLEASLRSQLFARLGVKNSSSKRGVGQKLKAETESSAHDGSEDSADPSMGNLPLSNAEKDLSFDLGGSERVERTLSELPVQIKANYHVEKFSSNYGSTSTAVPLDNRFLIEAYQAITPISVLYPVLKSAFVHMKVVDVVNLVQSHTECHRINPYVYDKNSSADGHYEIESVSSNSTPREETLRDICFNEVGFYSSNPDIDPLWPLCMYELRGKCNDEECAWQHVRNQSCKNLSIDNAIDGEVIAPSPGTMISGPTKFSKTSDLFGFTPPSYLVCTDILKANLHAYKSVLGESEACCWQKSFSASLVLSSLLPIGLISAEPFLHGPGARIESYGSWNRQSSYFHSRQGTLSQPNQRLIDNDESLEMALVILNQEVNKQKGRIEALKVLARALEADPTSAVLWIVYLHIYYCNQESIGKDDMFNYAVEHNGRSYELWLMYINSREQLEDRLIGYDTALSALSRDASPDRDAVHASECILDLFLQMMNTLCISGKVAKAIEKLNELFPSRMNSCEPHGLSDVVSCLTIWDKCIFWVCCVYLVMYKKLPDAVVSQFECQKELSALEWVSTQLTADEKQQAVRLMEMAVDYLDLDIDCDSHQSETAPKAVYLFALNHIRCLAVLEGLECSRNLLDKYIKLYPSCVELALVAARAHELDFVNTRFAGFEKALCNWLEDVPGVQCIWNQYAEYALQSGRENYVKKLMDRWFHSVWRVECEKSTGSQNHEAHICTSSDIDLSFGLLNLSLYKLLQNDRTEARSAIDKALEGASGENFKHCVREHAMFWLTEGSQSKDTPASEMLNILKGYLANSNAFPATELLSRKFIQTIKKSRVQQLVSNMFCPMSSDISLVNLVLQVCYGPSLLPQAYDKLTDLVDLVESVMEILPANYQLAISVCKLLSRTSNFAVVASSVSFWASSILVNALFQTVPVAPEYVWVEAATVLHNLTDIQSISLSFHKRALAVHPFSKKLWNSYIALCKITGDGNAVKSEAARRGIKLDTML